MRAVFNRDFHAYFNTMSGVFYAALFLLASGITFVDTCILSAGRDIAAVFSRMSVVLIFLCPLLTMNTFALERHDGSAQLLMSSPISITRVILGKFLAACAMFGSVLLLTFLYPLILTHYGVLLDLKVVTVYLGFFLLGISCIAVGMFVSCISRGTFSALLFGCIGLAVFKLLDLSVSLVENSFLAGALFAVSLFSSFEQFAMGIISLTNVLKPLSLCLLCLLMTRVAFEVRYRMGRYSS